MSSCLLLKKLVTSIFLQRNARPLVRNVRLKRAIHVPRKMEKDEKDNMYERERKRERTRRTQSPEERTKKPTRCAVCKVSRSFNEGSESWRRFLKPFSRVTEKAFFVCVHMSSSRGTGRERRVKQERASIGEHSESRSESEDWRTRGVPSRPAAALKNSSGRTLKNCSA